MRLIQFFDEQKEIRVGIVKNEEEILLLEEKMTMYQLAWRAIEQQISLESLLISLKKSQLISYPQLIEEGRIGIPVSHPDPAHILVSGTGLTHLGSASARNNMHIEDSTVAITDSMRMFQEGIKGGKPGPKEAGVQPEWFYKGDGSCLLASGEALPGPSFGLDYGEEPEIVGIYIIGPEGNPYRLGFSLGNEASDHVTEKQNYLLLAHSKLRPCAIGPELRLGAFPEEIKGGSRIWRGGKLLWEKEFLSGSANMSHSLTNLEYHHFKYPQFRRAGDVHVHFFGTATLSFSDNIRIQEGDEIEISAEGWGRALRNPILRQEVIYVPPKAL